MSEQKCPECGKPVALSLVDAFAGTHCGLVPRACRSERQNTELTAASAVIAAAEEMREDTCHGDKLEAFDAAMAEWRRVKGPLPQHPDHRDNCGSGCGNDQNGG